LGTEGAAMTNSDRPFSTIESAHEYLSALSEQINEIVNDIRGEISTSSALKQERRTEAWQTVLYTLTKLSFHTANSRRLVNDLRTLRNLLNRTSDPETEPSEVPGSSQPEAEGRSL
jgi:hypothetical protein